jgi:uncharacterized protein (TIRG00374 family)
MFKIKMKKRNIILFAKSVWRKPAARVFASFCILAILIYNIPLFTLWDTITQISPLLWATIVIAYLFGHLVGVAKWCLFINMGQNRLPFTVAAQCYFAGLFANLFLPSLAGGDVVRAGMAIRYKADKEAVIVGGLLDRFLDVCALGLIILISVLYSPMSLSVEGRSILISFFLSVFIFMLSILFIFAFPFSRLLPKRLCGFIEHIRNILKELIKKPKRALGALVISLGIQSGFIVLNAIIGMACNINLPLHIWFLTWPLAKLSAMVPVSLGGLGVRETALALLLLRFGIPFSSSVGVGLLWETVLIVGGIIGGFFYFCARKNMSISKLAGEDPTY